MNKFKRSICVGLSLAFVLGAGAYALDFSGIDSESLTFEENVDYAEIIINSCENGSDEALLKAAEYEIQRNKKIEELDLDYEQTKFFEMLEDRQEIIEAVTVFAETGNAYGVTQFSVDADVLNCREEAGIENEKVARFKEGSVVTFLSEGTDDEGNLWYQISYDDDITGWCMAEYLEKYDEEEVFAAAAQASTDASATGTATSNKEAAKEASKETASNNESAPETNKTAAASNNTDDDLYYLAAAITKEAGSSWITDEHQLMVGNVILNRVASSSYPDTIYGVLTQKGQYPWASKGISVTPTERAYANAQRLLDGERVLPENVVYQSTVTQGSGTYTSIYDATLGTTTYFCY